MIELFLVHWIFKSDNPLFPRENHLSFLISSVVHIEDLGNLTCDYKWLVPVPNLAKVNHSEAIPVFHDTLTSLNPSTPKNGHHEAWIQEFPYLFNLTIVRCLLHLAIKCIYTNNTVLLHAFLVLINCVKDVAIYVIALISCDCEERALCQLSKPFVYARA